MMAALKEWHTHYVCEVWKPNHETPGVPAQVLELPGIGGRLDACGNQVGKLRLRLQNLWARLNQAVADEIALDYSCQHYFWEVKETQDLLQEGSSDFHRYILRARVIYHFIAHEYSQDEPDRVRQMLRTIAGLCRSYGRTLQAPERAEWEELVRRREGNGGSLERCSVRSVEREEVGV